MRPTAAEDVQTGEVHVQHFFGLCATLKHKKSVDILFLGPQGPLVLVL